MFVPCPHCQFLVAHHPQLRPLPATCPRCGRALLESEEADTGKAIAHAPLQATYSAEAGMDETPVVHSIPDDGRLQDAAPVHGDNSTEQETTVANATAAPAASASSPATGATGDPAVAVASPMRAARIAGPRDLPRWRWPVVAVLGLALVLQVLLADRDRLAADPRWRPLMENVCALLRCSLQPWREPSAFSMLDRKVRPGAPGTLRVDATFRNDARWAQPWPALQLALNDADGRVLGSRVFAPQQYLGQAPGALLSPGQSAQVTFVVQEPAPGTVAFSFEFH